MRDFTAFLERLRARAGKRESLLLHRDHLERAEAAFNRGDFDALFAMFADDVEYVPPPALSEEPIHGKPDLLRFWHDVLRRYPEGEITTLELEEATPTRFTRTIRLIHRARDEQRLRYDLRQTTELDRGRVVRQVNRALLG